MKSLTFIAFAAIGTLQFAVDAATVNTPLRLVQCRPAAITWQDATGDVYITANQGTDTSGTPLVEFPVQQGASGSITWTPDLPEGTVVTLVITDGTGQANFSGQVTVQKDSTGTGSCSTSGVTAPSAAPSAPSASAGAPAASTTPNGSSPSTGPSGSNESGANGRPAGSPNSGSAGTTTRPASAPAATTRPASSQSGPAAMPIPNMLAAISAVAFALVAGAVGGMMLL